MSLDLAIIGCGAIGGYVARTVSERSGSGRVLVCDAVRSRAEALQGEVPGAEAVPLLEAVEGAEVVVEAASQDAVLEVGEAALPRGRTLVVLSVGAFGDPAVEDRLRALAADGGGTIRVPSGAIGGLDAVAAARQAGLDRVALETRKPPESLGMEGVAEPRAVFEGSAREAVRKLPRNVNVAAALSLAGVGFDETSVEVVVDPSIERNRHEVTLAGPFGRARFETRNDPSPDNPKTSFLAALSVVALLERRDASLVVGT